MPSPKLDSAAKRIATKPKARPLKIEPIVSTGIVISGELLRRTRRGAAQVSRGEYHSFRSVDEEMEFIFGKRG